MLALCVCGSSTTSMTIYTPRSEIENNNVRQSFVRFMAPHSNRLLRTLIVLELMPDVMTGPPAKQYSPLPLIAERVTATSGGSFGTPSYKLPCKATASGETQIGVLPLAVAV